MGWQKYKSIRQFNSLLFQDPTNPLNREEQRKAWQAQSQVNVLVKKTAKAFEIEKIPLTKEQKKAKWKTDSTGKAAKALDAFSFLEKKKETQTEADNIVNRMLGTQGGSTTLGMAMDLEPLATIHIVMDTAKESFVFIFQKTD